MSRASSWLARAVQSLSERASAAVSGAYASLARDLLTRSERLEDLAAERRHQRRARKPVSRPTLVQASKPRARPRAVSSSN